MIARGKGGSIVNISSIAGRIAIGNVPVYTASKGALEMLTKAMTEELGTHQVRQQTLNIVCTYLFKTLAVKCLFLYITNIVYMRS